ncbi:MAG TPA: transposase [Gaiellaceae bacterium]|nr:transposase [Gaiellaceae bacterium]
MPRPPRPNLHDGLYNIGSRGVRRTRIYRDEIDYRRFFALFETVSAELGWLCHARCQMPNHYHLLVETPEPNLSVGMKRLNSRYAQWFNWRHGFEGHAFERRFYSELVEAEAHFLELCRYIVLNPVRAKLCSHPGEWQFSSYRAPLTGRVAGLFGGGASARRRYRQFVAERVSVGRGSGSDPRTRPDQPKPYVPAKRSARRRTRSAAGRPTTLR